MSPTVARRTGQRLTSKFRLSGTRRGPRSSAFLVERLEQRLLLENSPQVPVPLAPGYADGSTRIDLVVDSRSSVSYTRFEEHDYFGNGSANSMTVEPSSVKSAATVPRGRISS